MKKLIIIFLLLLPIEAMSQSELYKRYASRQDLLVAQVSGFQLNDSVRVDVVLVVADNDAAWQRLKKELDIRGQEGVNSWLGNVNKPSQRMAWNGKPLLRVVASHTRRTVGFYRIDTEAQYDAIVDYQLRKIKK